MDKILQRGVSTIGDCKELVKKSSLRSPYQAEMGTWKAKAENETSVVHIVHYHRRLPATSLLQARKGIGQGEWSPSGACPA